MIRTFSFIMRGVKELVKIEFKMDLDHIRIPQDAFLNELRAKNQFYEPEVMCAMMRTIRPGDTVVDVGANSGFFTLFMAQLVGPTGKVLSFEPELRAFGRLNENVRLNKLLNVETFENPLWHTEEVVTVYVDQDSGGGNALWDPGLFPSNIKSKEKKVSYPAYARTLSQYINDARFIKIDAEGAEEAILRGFHGSCPFITAELNPFGQQQLGSTVESLIESMFDRGRRTFLLHESGQMPTLVPLQTKVKCKDDRYVMNVLFSDLPCISEGWPEAPVW